MRKRKQLGTQSVELIRRSRRDRFSGQRGHRCLRGRFLFFWRHVAFAWSKEQIGFHAVLFCVQLAIAAAVIIKRFVSSAFNDSPCFHDQNLIGAPNCGKAVRNHECGPPAHQVTKAFLNERFRFGVEARRRFIQNENSRIGKDRSGD